MLDSHRADQDAEQVAALYRESVPDAPLPANPVRALSERIDESRELADFLGVYGGNLSALDVLAELSRRVPKQLDVRFDEVNITAHVIRIKVSARTFEASERLTQVLAESPTFGSAEVKGSIETDRDGGKSFTIAISLTGSSEGTS